MSNATLIVVFAALAWQDSTSKQSALSVQKTSTQYSVLLESSAVRAELELADFQLGEIDKIALEKQIIEARMQRDLGGQGISKEERAEILHRAKEATDRLDAEVLTVLVPHQQKRLRQLQMQRIVQASKITGGLTSPRMVELLGLSEQQVDDIKCRSKEVQEKLAERVEELKREIEKAMTDARNDVMRSLTQEQRNRYSEAIGEVKPADFFGKQKKSSK